MTFKTFTQEQWLEKAKQVHKNKYDYSLVEYVNSNIKIKIICKIHGVFEQRPNTHLLNHGCPICGEINKHNTKLLNSGNMFINKSNIVHNKKYDYSLVEYIGVLKKVKIICLKHGSFEIRPNNHLNGQGCPKCANGFSKREFEILQWLKNNNINYKTQYMFMDCRCERKLPFDFYLPDHKTCIEFDGIYHYEPKHGIKSFLKTIKNDSIKTEYCKNNNIKLIRIPYWESKNIDQILSKELLLDYIKLSL